MRAEALFVNGVFEEVLADIARVQTAIPEQVLYLQPYSAQRIVKLFEWAPSVEVPVQLLLSTTGSLATVSYVADVIAARDKSELSEFERNAIDAIIRLFQPTEGGVYDEARGVECRNLIGVRNMHSLARPFDVTQLRLLSTSEHPTGARSTAGGWWYVHADADVG